eukprot:scaffold4423_cov344-Prasinococcus_capsulatus_cf.AAC.2
MARVPQAARRMPAAKQQGAGDDGGEDRIRARGQRPAAIGSGRGTPLAGRPCTCSPRTARAMCPSLACNVLHPSSSSSSHAQGGPPLVEGGRIPLRSPCSATPFVHVRLRPVERCRTKLFCR